MRRKPQETADFRRKPQKTADFCRKRFLPFVVSLLARSYVNLRKLPTDSVFCGDGLNTVSESTVSSTELSEFFWPGRVPGGERTPLSLIFVCQANSASFSQISPSLPFPLQIQILDSKRINSAIISATTVRTRSTTTRDRNLQFRGAVSTGGSPLDFLLFLQVLCVI